MCALGFELGAMSRDAAMAATKQAAGELSASLMAPKAHYKPGAAQGQQPARIVSIANTHGLMVTQRQNVVKLVLTTHI